MHNPSASYWVTRLNLQPHPEGGYYKEVFRSSNTVNRIGSNTARQACTSIYYLLEGEDYSGFHRIQSDEIWYYHKGAPLNIHIINENGNHGIWELSDSDSGALCVVVPAGLWFAAEIPSKKDFALVSCAVAPGFEFREFEMADKEMLQKHYPAHYTLFNKFCR